MKNRTPNYVPLQLSLLPLLPLKYSETNHQLSGNLTLFPLILRRIHSIYTLIVLHQIYSVLLVSSSKPSEIVLTLIFSFPVINGEALSYFLWSKLTEVKALFNSIFKYGSWWNVRGLHGLRLAVRQMRDKQYLLDHAAMIVGVSTSLTVPLAAGLVSAAIPCMKPFAACLICHPRLGQKLMQIRLVVCMYCSNLNS